MDAPSLQNHFFIRQDALSSSVKSSTWKVRLAVEGLVSLRYAFRMSWSLTSSIHLYMIYAIHDEMCSAQLLQQIFIDDGTTPGSRIPTIDATAN